MKIEYLVAGIIAFVCEISILYSVREAVDSAWRSDCKTIGAHVSNGIAYQCKPRSASEGDKK